MKQFEDWEKAIIVQGLIEGEPIFGGRIGEVLQAVAGMSEDQAHAAIYKAQTGGCIKVKNSEQ